MFVVFISVSFFLIVIRTRTYLLQRLATRVSLVREIVKEVAGMAPYEKRIAELLRIGKDKRALKYAKKKLGTHVRGKRKREEIADVLRKARK